MANIYNARTWREAAKKASRSREIHKALREVINHTHIGVMVKQKIAENAHLIKTLPLSLSQEVTKYVASEAYKGLRSSTIAKDLHSKIEQYSNAKANLIARTETGKAMTALTEARSKDLGINWYIWKTANDGNRVRESHRNMQNVLVRYDNPPAPEQLIGEKSEGNYNAGNIYNCRCYPRPVIDLNQVPWPAKVYYNGSIQSMTRLQFEQINNIKPIVQQKREETIEDKIVNGKWIEIKEGTGETHKVEVGNKTFFLKKEKDEKSVRTEVAAYKIADKMGIGEYSVKTEGIELNNKKYSISEFVEGNALDNSYTRKQLLKQLPDEDREMLGLYDFIVGEYDRHDKNILFKHNKPKLIDNEGHFTNGTDAGVDSVLFEEALGNDEVSYKTAKKLVSMREGLQSIANKYGLDKQKFITKRINVLESLMGNGEEITYRTIKEVAKYS